MLMGMVTEVLLVWIYTPCLGNCMVMFTIELINNQQEGENASDFKELNWEKPSTEYHYLGSFNRILSGFLEHSKLSNFLFNDTLSF